MQSVSYVLYAKKNIDVEIVIIYLIESIVVCLVQIILVFEEIF